MAEIKCPKCGEVFKVDENEYASIVSQIKEQEINNLKNTIKINDVEHASKIKEAIEEKQNKIVELNHNLQTNILRKGDKMFYKYIAYYH